VLFLYFSLYREKFDIKDEGDGTLSYVQNSTYYFNKESSGNLSEDDVVTVINMALLVSSGYKFKLTALSNKQTDKQLIKYNWC
jgi:hypothetical protein